MLFTKRFCLKSLIILTGVLIPHFHACLVGAAVQIKEYPIPSAKGIPVGITSGPDGVLWFTEVNVNKIGRIDPATHIITEYPIPTPKSGAAEGITSGPDGAIWFSEGGTGDTDNGANKIGRIDLTTHQITEYPTLSPGSGPALIVSGPDNAIWFTEQFVNKIGRIDPSNPTDISEYSTPSSDPWGITLGPDNALWFNQCGPNNLVRIDPATHDMQEYTADGICGELTSGPDGAIWFIAFHNALHPKIGRFDLLTHVVDEYPVPTPNSNPDNITSGPDGALWFNEINASKIGRIDPTTHQITEYPTPTHHSIPLRIVSGPDGALWFAEAFGNKIGQVILPNAPAAPTAVAAQNTGVGQATVSFTPSASPGDNSSIAGYTVRSIPDGGTDTDAGSSSTTHTVTGLSNGTSYTFTVTATNTNKFSNSSTPSKKITTWTAPSQTKVISLKNTYTTDVNAQVTVKFSAPKSNGGTPITGYTVTALTAEQVPTGTDMQANSTSLTHVVNDLPPGKPYTFTVTATNAAGLTSTSNASKAITAVTIPYCVKDLSATAPPNTKGTLLLTFTPPYDGGSPITKYLVYNKTGNNVGPLKKINANDETSSLTVKGLKSGQTYTIQIGAANVIGANVCSNILTSATPN
jgi:virginiamycin B lyase